MNKIKTAVVGVGYLGQYHADKYATLANSHLVAVCDIDKQRAEAIANKYNVASETDYKNLLGKVDAVSIAVPTVSHHQVAAFFLRHKIHVLLEKPIATTLAEADDLIQLAKQNQVILQVGHLERFNNAVSAATKLLSKPMFIESTRLAPFQLRGTDVNVVLDLMIHDIDLIQWMVRSEIKDIRANGAPVLSSFLDIANARIEFTNGCVANVTASRISMHRERKLRIFQHDNFLALDLDNKTLGFYQKGRSEMYPGIPEITREEQAFEQGDPILLQIQDFTQAIIDQRPPLVSGEDGKHALATAIRITQTVKEFHAINTSTTAGK